MGNLLILKDADFSSQNIGNSKVKEIDIQIAVAGKIHDGRFGQTEDSVSDIATRFIVPSQSNDMWGLTNNLSQEIAIEETIKTVYLICPLVVTAANLPSIVNDKFSPADTDAIANCLLYYEIDNAKWRSTNYGRINEIYAIKERAINNSFAVVLARFQSTPFSDNVHKFRIQWQSNSGDAFGAGIYKPRVFVELL